MVVVEGVGALGGGGGPFEMAMGMAQPLNYRDDFSQVLRASIHGP